MSSIENEVRNRILNMVNGNIFSLNVDRNFVNWIMIKSIIISNLSNNKNIPKKYVNCTEHLLPDYKHWKFWIGSSFGKPGLAAFSQSNCLISSFFEGSEISSEITLTHFTCGNALFICTFSDNPSFIFDFYGDGPRKLLRIFDDTGMVDWPFFPKIELKDVERMETMLFRANSNLGPR
ncbi:hypothetical protein [Sphingobium sp.]|uniref:hypothetical protein n=1 Tax=Sphingobium sp. TaxID=1912891 RepID=UPI00263074E3|nr:hypothetical protein [Sphingobium sp.]